MPGMALLQRSGPFISGTTHQVLELGQVVLPSAEPTRNTVAPPGLEHKLAIGTERQTSNSPSDKTPSPAGPGPSTSGSKLKGGSSSFSCTLSDMLQAGIVQPGQDNTTVTYKGAIYTASLQATGTILFKGIEFSTPSAFSVHVKRLVTPNKQGDDGWHSVYVNGIMLHHLRLRYQQQQQQPGGNHLPPLPSGKRQASSSKGAGAGQQAKRQKQSSGQQQQLGQQQQQQAGQLGQQQGSQQQQGGVIKPLGLKLKLGKIGGQAGKAAVGQVSPGTGVVAAAAAAVTKGNKASAGPPSRDSTTAAGLRWVRCCRCEVQRCVPPQHWPQVHPAHSRGEWVCEDAAWDVTALEPFTPACVSDAWTEGS